MNPRKFDIYGVGGEWKDNGIVAASHSEALLKSVQSYVEVVRPNTPYIVVEQCGPGHGKAKLLKAERVEVPSYRVVSA